MFGIGCCQERDHLNKKNSMHPTLLWGVGQSLLSITCLAICRALVLTLDGSTPVLSALKLETPVALLDLSNQCAVILTSTNNTCHEYIYTLTREVYSVLVPDLSLYFSSRGGAFNLGLPDLTSLDSPESFNLASITSTIIKVRWHKCTVSWETSLAILNLRSWTIPVGMTFLCRKMQWSIVIFVCSLNRGTFVQK